MPTVSQYSTFLFVNLAFISLLAYLFYSTSLAQIRDQWPKYRCNPAYWIFSSNLQDDFTYCVQNTQSNLMGYMLQPFNYLTSSLSQSTSQLGSDVQNIRSMLSTVRDFTSTIVQNIFGVFLNLVIEFQRILLSLKDMVGKLIGVMVTFLYLLDGSLKTMNSAWNGPPGQLVKALGGSCFHPLTLVPLLDGSFIPMDQLLPGSLLLDGSLVLASLRILPTEPLLFLRNSSSSDGILVSGSHYVWYSSLQKFIPVSLHPDSHSIRNDLLHSISPLTSTPSYFCSLITDTHHFRIGSHLFYDWEDDILTQSGIP